MKERPTADYRVRVVRETNELDDAVSAPGTRGNGRPLHALSGATDHREHRGRQQDESGTAEGSVHGDARF